jgi:phage host-nuclease inhibitor protein Gam
MDAQENAEKIILARIKQMEKTAKKYEDQINELFKQIDSLEKENRKLLKDDNKNNEQIINENKQKIKELLLDIKKLNKQKEDALGVPLDLNFRDDSNIRPNVDI